VRTESRVVMLTDMKGFTAATVRQTREENARMLALHEALLAPVMEAFGGWRVKEIGDAYLVLFAAPTEALLCAAAIQDRLWDHARRAAEAERIEVRVALSMGDVRLDGGDVFGEAVNLAARIEGQAEPGEIWFSEALYWALDRSRVPVEELGWRTLDGLKEEVRLFRVARAFTEGGEEGTGAPYAGIGLSLVAGLPPPDPEKLRAAGGRRRMRLGGAGPLTGLAGRAAVALLALGAAGALAWWFWLGPVERVLKFGRFEDARAEVEALALARGGDDPEVLLLRGRVELARFDAAAGGSVRGAFALLARAVAGGSRPAAALLGSEGRSEDCGRRRAAARALGESRVREALPALEAMAAAEPPAPEPAGALERVKRAVVGDGRCGAGDVARDAIAEIEALHRGARR